jgi:lysophospholipase L1-like esterase
MKKLPASLHPVTSRWLSLLLAAALGLAAGCQHRAEPPPPNSIATHNSSRWEKDMAAFDAADAKQAPARGGIVFVGSSSIRMWSSLAKDFPDRKVLNRGFGGSQLADAVHHAERAILRYQPRQVVIYAGGNDLNAKKTPAIVYGDFVALVTKIRATLPQARIAYISIAGNPARWAQVEQVKQINALIAAYCRRHGHDYIDVFNPMLGPDGLPLPDIFLKDRLHMNEKGYAIWREVVRPYLVKTD